MRFAHVADILNETDTLNKRRVTKGAELQKWRRVISASIAQLEQRTLCVTEAKVARNGTRRHSIRYGDI